MKIVYFGYDLFADCLSVIEELGIEIMAIYTFPTDGVCDFNDRVRAFAASRAIPCTVGRVTAEELSNLAARGCDWMVSAGYAYRIPVTPDGPRGVNLHPACLPIGRGPWPMPVTILRGLTESGVTLHKLAPKFDRGDILIQTVFPLAEKETLPSLTAKLAAAAPVLLRSFFADPEVVWASGIPQAGGEYWPEPTPEEMTITPEHTAEEADRILRAFMGVGCYARGRDGVRIPVVRAAVTDQKTAFPLKDAYLRINP